MFIAFDGYGSGKEDVRLSPDVTRGLLRHYDDFFEACVAQGKHGLSCIILMPQGTGSGSSRELPWADENSVYSREDFEAIMSQDSDELRGIVQDVRTASRTHVLVVAWVVWQRLTIAALLSSSLSTGEPVPRLYTQAP